MIRILHLASFTGNIGDNANHIGFRSWFQERFSKKIIWENLEIREFYWKKRNYNIALIDFINQFDLFVIGGGNYFELWVEDSPTGTSIAIDPVLFKKIKIPVFFNALGVDPGLGVPSICKDRFSKFLDILVHNDQYQVTVRNDGALWNLEKFIGSKYSEKVNRIPDGGFFLNNGSFKNKSTLEQKKTYIGINLACDLPEVRFENASRKEFAKAFAKTINEIALRYPNYIFIFFPHIYSDIDIINTVIKHMDDPLRRSKVIVSQYGVGDHHTINIFANYYRCKIILGMRFHSNVCPIGLGIPVIGLFTYMQVENLYKELNLENYLVDLRKNNFSKNILNLISHIENNYDLCKSDFRKATFSVSEMRKQYTPLLENWLEKLRLS